MAICFWNIRTKNYFKMLISLQVTIDNVGIKKAQPQCI